MRSLRKLAASLLFASVSLFLGNTNAMAGFGVSNSVYTESVIWGDRYWEWPLPKIARCESDTSFCSAESVWGKASDNIGIGSASGTVQTSSTDYGFGSSAVVNGFWWDTFTVTSPTLDNGSAVTVYGSIALRGDVRPSQGVPVPYTRAHAYMTTLGFDATGGSSSFVTTRTDTVLDSTGSFQAFVGSSVTVYGYFYAATGSSGVPGDSGSVNAAASYGLWVSDPRVTLTSMSGHVFAPVPEPESYAMFLVGLGLLAGVVRRKQK